MNILSALRPVLIINKKFEHEKTHNFKRTRIKASYGFKFPRPTKVYETSRWNTRISLSIPQASKDLLNMKPKMRGFGDVPIITTILRY